MTTGVKTRPVRPRPEPESAAPAEVIDWSNPSASHPGLIRGELHLWRIRTDARGADLDLCLARLGGRQLERAERMRHAAYRERYIRAQAGLRSVLSGYLEVAPERISFQYGPAGKPYLDQGAERLSFNLSTTGDLALVGVRLGGSAEDEIGVDCEWIRPRGDYLAVAERMMTPSCVEELRNTPDEARLAAFYSAWTALEADAKCDGRGLFRPRAADALHPLVRHCIPETGYIAALASPRLPQPAAWCAFDWTLA